MATFSKTMAASNGAPPYLAPGSYVTWDIDAPEETRKCGYIVRLVSPDRYEVKPDRQGETEKVLTWAVRVVQVREPWQYGIPFLRGIIDAQNSVDPARWAAVDSLLLWMKERGTPLQHLESEDVIPRANAAKRVLEWGVATYVDKNTGNGHARNKGHFMLMYGHDADKLMAEFRHAIEHSKDVKIRAYVSIY